MSELPYAHRPTRTWSDLKEKVEMPSFKSLTGLDAKPVLIIFVCVFLIASSGFWTTSRLSVHYTSVNVHTGAELNPMIHTTPGEDVLSDVTGIEDRPAQDVPTNGSSQSVRNGRKALIIASFMEQNVSWVDYMPHEYVRSLSREMLRPTACSIQVLLKCSSLTEPPKLGDISLRTR